MAKKRKNKFSKTKQRPKSKIRAEVDKIKAKIGGGNTLTPTMASTYLNTLSDAANASNIAPGTITLYPSLSGGAAAMFFNKSDGGGSKRVMHINLTQTTPKGDTKMNDALRAAIENDGNLPAEIAVSAKNGDEAAVQSQLEQMVADMNEEARGDATKQQYRIEQDGDAVPTPNGKRLNLKFKLTPIAADAPPVLTPVMSSAELREGLGKDAKLTGSRQYTRMLAALDTYHAHLDAYLQSLDDKSETPTQLTTANDLKNDLLTAVDAYLRKHPRDKSGKKNAAERLKEQLNTGDQFREAKEEAFSVSIADEVMANAAQAKRAVNFTREEAAKEIRALLKFPNTDLSLELRQKGLTKDMVTSVLNPRLKALRATGAGQRAPEGQTARVKALKNWIEEVASHISKEEFRAAFAKLSNHQGLAKTTAINNIQMKQDAIGNATPDIAIQVAEKNMAFAEQDKISLYFPSDWKWIESKDTKKVQAALLMHLEEYMHIYQARSGEYLSSSTGLFKRSEVAPPDPAEDRILRVQDYDYDETDVMAQMVDWGFNPEDIGYVDRYDGRKEYWKWRKT